MSDRDPMDASSGGVAARLGNDFRVRLASGVVMATAAALLTVAGSVPFAVLVAAAALLVSWEWGRLVHGPENGAVLAVLLGTTGVAAFLAAIGYVALGLLALPIGAILATVLSLGRNSLFSALGIFYAGFPAVALIWLRSDPWHGLLATVFVIAIVATSDTAAFFSGRLLKGPLLWERVSPNKTWAGMIGALAACAVVGALFWFAVPEGSALRLGVTGAVLSFVAQVGDLAESALKRRFGAKDAGSLIPGHGGVMDRVDGVIAAASAVGLVAVVVDVYSPASALLYGL